MGIDHSAETDARARRHSRAQIAALLDQVLAATEAGKTITQACAAIGLPEATYYRWRARLAGAAARQPTREKILEAAQALFLREGQAVGLDAVAEAANVTRQTLYNLFGGKEKLFREAVQAIYGKLLRPITTLEPREDLRATLLEYGRQVLEVGLDPRMVALLRLTVTESRNFPDLGRTLYGSTARPLPALSTYFDAEIAAGRMRPCDTEFAAEFFIGALTSHPRYRALLRISEEPPEKCAARLHAAVDLFVAGMAAVRQEG